MLEVLGIRTGVTDGDVDSDSEEDRPYLVNSRRYTVDEDPSYLYGTGHASIDHLHED